MKKGRIMIAKDMATAVPNAAPYKPNDGISKTFSAKLEIAIIL